MAIDYNLVNSVFEATVGGVYSIYVTITIITALLMLCVKRDSGPHYIDENIEELSSRMKRISVARILISDSKMKYFFPFCLAQGISCGTMSVYLIAKATSL